MKKLNRLFAILIAVLGVGSLSAQTDVTNTYLTNAGFDDNSSWITGNVAQATTKAAKGWTATSSGDTWWYGGAVNYGSSCTVNSVTPPAKNPEGNADGGALGLSAGWGCTVTYKQEVTLPAGVYTLSYKAYNANTGATQANNYIGFTSSSVTVYGKTTNFTANTWVEESVTFMLSSQTTGNISVGMGAISGGSGSNAKLFVDGVKLSYKSFSDVTEANPVDLTSWLQDPGFEEASGGAGTVNIPPGWSMKYTLSGWLDGTPNGTNPSEGSKCYNIWAGTFTSVDMYQTVTLPAGKYTVMADLRTEKQEQITNQGVYASIAGVVTKSGTITKIGNPWNGKEAWNTLSATFNNGSAGEVVIGISSTGNGGSNGWFQADNVRLLYLGFDLTEANNTLNTLITTAQSIVTANEVSPKSIENLNSAIAAGQSVAQNKEAIEQASNNLTAAINAANATIDACNEYRTILALSESMYTNSKADDKSEFASAINTAKSDFNNAANSDAIRAISAALKEAQKDYCLVASPAEGHPFDMTHLVVNPKFDEGTNGWAHNTGAPNWGIATNQGGAITGNYFENWKWESYTGEIYQELTGLPKGTYQLTAAAFRDQLIDGASDGDAVYVFANDTETLVNSGTPAFYSVEVSTTTGTLRFGVKSKVEKYRWMGIDNVSLLFLEGLDLTEFTNAYNTALEAAIAARDNAEYSKVTGAEKTALLNAIAIVPEQTQKSLSDAATALTTATAAFTAAKGDYDILDSEITVARNLGMTDDAINTVTAGKTGAAAYSALKVAEYTYIYNTYTEDAPIGNWESQFDQIDGQSYDGTNVKYFDKWGDGTFALKQTVTLPKGDYAISVIARGQSGASGTLYYKIGEETTSTPLIMKNDTGFGVDINGVANFSSTGTYSNNNNGRGWEYRFITFHLDAETSVEFGVTATVNWQWASVYAPQLLTDPSSKKALLLTEIEHLLSNVPSGVMNAEVQITLNDTKAAAQGASNANTTAELNTIYADFKNAIDEANTSIDTYSKASAYIAKAKAIGVALADDYQTQYDNRTLSGDAVTIFQNLEVATYNYVMSNFTYPVKLSDTWNSTGTNTQAATFSNEHWSGETREYKNQDDSNGQGWNASSWTIDFDQEVTLPAGEYVFKVAGRKSESTTLELVVTMGATVLGTVNDFPASNNSRGINKLGATSFDPEDEAGFARNGEGFGWQWRYVKFTLAAESTVKVAVHAEANEVHQWVSFGDYTLQMTEETYLEANKGGLDAPTAAANALVDTKPMGTEENNALKAALAMTYTTGAELLAKIEALETAVANANQWVVDYNNAKAPLVVALERFEADYNNAENGALNHMNKDRWATAINMAQEAAVAKDVLDSYEGFETATKNLNAALDAATTSVNEYSALDAAIKTAKPLYEGGNWGDQAFQRPESAKESLNTEKAKKVYDAATADGEGVTSVTDALNNGLNGIVINEPAEGDVFKVAISFGNWDFNGKPLTFADNGKDGVSMYRDRDANYYAQTLMLKKVEGNKYTMSTIAADGTELYASTGITSGVGANTAQIRLTDDATKALSIEIIPTATEGLYNLKNTEADALLGCQDDNSKEKGGLFTVGVRNDFTITKVDMPSVTLKTPSYWATLILPFAAEIPKGLTVYSCAGADGEVLTLETVESIEANTPYLVCGATTDFEHTFTGFGAATTTSYTVGLFTGTFVDYKTTANSNTYVLQKNNGDVAFYLVGESAQPTVNPNRIYMTYEAAAGAPKFVFSRGEGTTSIDNSQMTIDNSQLIIYDLMGRKVNTMEKGNMYIINGKKVIIR